MYEKTLRRHLYEIIDNLGIEDPAVAKAYKSFKLEITNKTYKTKSGDYNYRTQKIRITQTSTHNNANEVKTALHELAHHLDYCNRGKSGHDEEFYAQFARLIYSALDLDKITLEEMREMNRSNSDYRKVQKILGAYERKPAIARRQTELTYEINVPGLAANDPRLFAYGYQYNQRRKTWYRNIAPNAIDFERTMLKSLGIEEIQLLDSNTIQMLDDEGEYMAYQKELAERKEAISKHSKEEFRNLTGYIGKLLNSGYEFEDLNDVLAGYGLKKEEEGESFRFRYITLAGTLIQDDHGIRLSDEFDVYEYRKKDALLVLHNVTVDNIDQQLESLR